jgi:oxygen-independent coproporphyrinogen-3 oxidase
MPGLSATPATELRGDWRNLGLSFRTILSSLEAPKPTHAEPPAEVPLWIPSHGTSDDIAPTRRVRALSLLRLALPVLRFRRGGQGRDPARRLRRCRAVRAERARALVEGEKPFPLASIYFGGGTPGLWRPDALGRVLARARARPLRAAAKSKSPSRPTQGISTGDLRDLRALGVNRLSFGAQAFQDRLLKRIGRGTMPGHPAAFAAARAAGFDNLCADLDVRVARAIHGRLAASLAALCALGPQHITAYALTVEPGTRFGALERAGKLDRPDRRPRRHHVHRVPRDPDRALATSTTRSRPTRGPAGAACTTACTGPWAPISAWGFGLVVPAAGSQGGAGVFQSALRRHYLRGVRAFAGALPPEQVELRSPEQIEDEALWLGLRMSDGVDRQAHERATATTRSPYPNAQPPPNPAPPPAGWKSRPNACACCPRVSSSPTRWQCAWDAKSDAIPVPSAGLSPSAALFHPTALATASF